AHLPGTRLSSLTSVLSSLNRYLLSHLPVPLDAPVHDFSIGDWVFVRTWRPEPLTEKWVGPHQVLLTSYTACKVAGIRAWIHHTRLKSAPEPEPAPTGGEEDKDLWTLSRVLTLKNANPNSHFFSDSPCQL
uniref:Murine leukemia virus integrase C-terminal domain-containing protein n=1 Tax=Anolis carolinensis TaxID=28377 RepID=A0A803TGE3_ANOCA